MKYPLNYYVGNLIEKLLEYILYFFGLLVIKL